jgi:hypothetical protein
VTSEKSYDTAQRIDAQIAGGWTIPFEAVKSGNEGRSTTTSSDDADLQIPVTPGHWYFDALLLYHGGAGSSEGDFKWTFTIPTGSIQWECIVRLASDAGNLHDASVQGSGVTINAYTNGLTTTYILNIQGSFDITASGTFTLRWAKGQSSDTNTTLEQYSRISANRRI